MKRRLQVGLLVEGNSTRSAILRMPRLAEELGPIKSPVFRVARRISNFLHAGYAVSSYADMQKCRLILMKVPDDALAQTVDELCASELDLNNFCFVLCESWLSSDALRPLALRGSSVATLVAAPGRRSWFIAEGDVPAIRQARKLIEADNVKILEVRPGHKPHYFAADLLVAALTVPLLQAAQQSLRTSGITGNHLQTLFSEMVEQTLRDFLKGGHNWGGPLNECSEELAAYNLRELTRTDPRLGRIVQDQLTWAQQTLSGSHTPPRTFS